MPGRFMERRHEFREPVDDGRVMIGGRAYRLVNWSAGGFMAAGSPLPTVIGGSVPCRIELRTNGTPFDFDCTARIVRADPDGDRFGAQYDRIEPDVAGAIQRYFHPWGATASAAAGVAYTRLSPPPPPAWPPPDIDATSPGAGSVLQEAAALCLEWSLGTVGRVPPDGSDPAEVRRQLSRLKAAVARRYHPDAAGDPADRRLRAEIFTRVWEQLESLEAGLSGAPVDEGTGRGRQIR